MNVKTIAELIPILQTSVGPMILISGLGLLLLTMTNRLGRTIDRSRQLLDEYEELPTASRSKVDREIVVLWKRASYVRTAILFASATCLGAATLVITLFLTGLFRIDAPIVVSTVFIMSMLSLIAALVFFVLDVNLTLSALRIELEGHRRH
ncbi:MAG: DUF2721 domain-containing protein [Chlorobiaceae bacterium]|nr:DUF2721 domain-containing protein [Chlorobiaceae bacterium]